MHDRIGLLYLERLGADDVELLADAARRAGHRDIDAARLHAEPNRIIPLLSEQTTRDTVFGAPEELVAQFLDEVDASHAADRAAAAARRVVRPRHGARAR